MGSWNVTCAVSNLSIHWGDKVKYIPMIPAKYIALNENNLIVLDQLNQVVSNEGAENYLVPLFLPFTGYYDDYGRLEKIIEDNNTKIICDKLNITIDDFEDFFFDWENKGFDEYKYDRLPIYGIYILDEVWNKVLEYQRPLNSQHKSAYQHYSLEPAGFKFIGEHKEFQRYKQIYIREDMPNLLVGSDGKWIQLFNKDYEYVTGAIYSFEDLQKYIKHFFGYDLEDRPELLEMSAPQIMIEEELKEQIERMNFFKKNRGALKRKDDVFDELFDIYGDYKFFEVPYMRNLYKFKEIYMGKDYAVDPDIIKQFVEYKYVTWFMYSINKLWLPQLNGTQTGDEKATKYLGELIIEHSLNILKEYDEDYYEEDEV